MLTRYDPDHAPDPRRWLAEDEGVRIELARRYHRRERIRLPNENLHAIIHATVETQVAMGDEIPVAAKLRQLMDEGLSRHDAIHAVGTVLAWHMRNLIAMEGEPDHDLNEDYYHELAELTAEGWRKMYEEGNDE